MTQETWELLLQSDAVQAHIEKKIEALIQAWRQSEPHLSEEEARRVIRLRLAQSLRDMENNPRDDLARWVIATLPAAGDDLTEDLEKRLAGSGVEPEIIAELVERLRGQGGAGDR